MSAVKKESGAQDRNWAFSIIKQGGNKRETRSRWKIICKEISKMSRHAGQAPRLIAVAQHGSGEINNYHS